MDLLTGAVAGLAMIGVLVIVHEFGHFIVAKALGIGVPVFSVGMGPQLASFHWRGTEYQLSWLPVGGYVRLAGADPFGEQDPDAVEVPPEQDFMRRPIWQRLLVMFAGPGFNLLLPVLIFTMVLMAGEEMPSSVVSRVAPNTPAAAAGFQEDDRILSVEGETVDSWLDVEEAVKGKSSVVFQVERDGKPLALTVSGLTAADDTLGAIGLYWTELAPRVGVDDPSSPAGKAGLKSGDRIVSIDGTKVETLREVFAALTPGAAHQIAYQRQADGKVTDHSTTLQPDASWSPAADEPVPHASGLVPFDLYVRELMEGKPAEKAGIQADDRMLAMDGVPLYTWEQLVRRMASTAKGEEEAKPRAVKLLISRGGKRLTLDLTPEMLREVRAPDVVWRPVIGIQGYESVSMGPTHEESYPVWKAIPEAVRRTWLVTAANLAVMRNILLGDLKVSETLSGPIDMFRMAAQAAKSGFDVYINRIALVSVGLAVFNLLPIPVLDGGQILFYIIEGLRGRPLSLAIREKILMAGVLAMVALMLWVTVLGIQRIFAEA